RRPQRGAPMSRELQDDDWPEDDFEDDEGLVGDDTPGVRDADAEIVNRLVEQGFDPTSQLWKELSDALVEYGYGVFVAWLISGTVHRKAAEVGTFGVRGLSRIPKDLRLSREDAHDLSVDLVKRAITRFHSTLRDEIWRPSGGASLSTFFVGRCLME